MALIPDRRSTIRLSTLAGAILLTLSASAQAATIVVTHPNDHHVPGGCSLREAVQSATSNVAPPGTNCAVGGTVDLIEVPFTQVILTEGALVVGGAVNTIQGTADERTVIARATQAAPFPIIIHNGGDLTLHRLEIKRGQSSNCGGGIVSEITENNHLVVSDSVIADNQAEFGGGGICLRNQTQLTLERSTVSGNSAGLSGGGIAGKYRMTIIDSTISGNTAGEAGGGIVHGTNLDSNHLLLIENSTIAGNTAEGSGDIKGGGGIMANRAAVTIRNSTIVRNEVHPDASGGGVMIGNALGATMILSSSLVAGNMHGKYGQDIDAEYSFTIAGSHNLVRTAGDDIVLPADTLACPPNIAPLGDHGGPTRTVPLRGTCGVDAGLSNGLGFDQRGEGFPRVVGAAADIGAFEYSDDDDDDLIFADGFEDM